MIKLIIFDLDNTLFDTYNQLSLKVLDEMIARMKKAGLSDSKGEEIKRRYAFSGFRLLARSLGLSDEIARIGMGVYEDMDISGIRPFPDVKVLGALPQEKIVVTSGLTRIQQAKVDILGLRSHFREVIVDESVGMDSKQEIFADAARKRGLSPGEVMVVGDYPPAEIAAGRNIGMVTVQVLRVPQAIRGEADHHIKSLEELKDIIDGYED